MKYNYIITITSGLGNQMCQYALFCYLKFLNQKVKVYCWDKHLNEHNGLELTNIFTNTELYLENSKIISYYIDFIVFCNAVRAKINNRFINKCFNFLGKIFPKVSVIPQWDNYLFVNDIRGDLINDIFIFPEITDEKNTKLKHSIYTTSSISIHIRRTDYIENPRWRCSHGDICNIDYYKHAINYINSHIENPQFIVFSDDIKWSKDNLLLNNAIFVDWNKGKENFRDMQLMSLCKHNIIANSSFSWWGAVLNQNNDKIVISPSKWLNTVEQRNAKKFNFPDWVIIDNNYPNVSLIIEDVINNKILKNILQQTYEDFEILIQKNYNKDQTDKRIKELSNNKPLGNHKFIIDNEELKLFKNRHYLFCKLIQYFKILNNFE
ncbi:hypothetical protein FACS189451_02940 [Bacteroidia bacterium]|nr:hypothetical protein FACS189451_02940 [Bacteroidia bacterium]